MKVKEKRPLTIPPPIEVDEEGVEWLLFQYTAKGHSLDYKIRIDIDKLSSGDFDDNFKFINSIYPKAALCTQKEYKGNRWDYESAVNDIGWKLTWLNPDILTGKRGLLQRAVDSFRNTNPESKSRRVARVEKTSERGPSPGLSAAPRTASIVAAATISATVGSEFEDENGGHPSDADSFSGAISKKRQGGLPNAPPKRRAVLSVRGLPPSPEPIPFDVSSTQATRALKQEVGLSVEEEEEEEDNDGLLMYTTLDSGDSLNKRRIRASSASSSATMLPLTIAPVSPGDSKYPILPYSASATPLASLPISRPPSRNGSPKAIDSRQRLIVETVKNSAPYQFRLRMDINAIPKDGVAALFISQNTPFSKPKTHRELLCNSIAWKLAFLNQDILVGKRELLQRSVDVYMQHFEEEINGGRGALLRCRAFFSDNFE